MFFPNVHKTVERHMVGHKTTLSNLKNWDLTEYIIGHNGIKLEIKNNEKEPADLEIK